MLAYEKFGARIPAHGRQWKNEYSKLLTAFIANKIFPGDVERELLATIENPAASSCAEKSLLRVLRKYDDYKPGHYLLEDLLDGSFFKTKNGTLFLRMYVKRVRILCREMNTDRLFLFSPVTEVKYVHKNAVKQFL